MQKFTLILSSQVHTAKWILAEEMSWGSQNVPYRMGAPQEPTQCVQEGQFQGGLLTHIWGARGLGQGRIAVGWGTHTSLCRQTQMRRGVCDPHSLGGGCVPVHVCINYRK